MARLHEIVDASPAVKGRVTASVARRQSVRSEKASVFLGRVFLTVGILVLLATAVGIAGLRGIVTPWVATSFGLFCVLRGYGLVFCGTFFTVDMKAGTWQYEQRLPPFGIRRGGAVDEIRGLESYRARRIESNGESTQVHEVWALRVVWRDVSRKSLELLSFDLRTAFERGIALEQHGTVARAMGLLLIDGLRGEAAAVGVTEGTPWLGGCAMLYTADGVRGGTLPPRADITPDRKHP